MKQKRGIRMRYNLKKRKEKGILINRFHSGYRHWWATFNSTKWLVIQYGEQSEVNCIIVLWMKKKKNYNINQKELIILIAVGTLLKSIDNSKFYLLCQTTTGSASTSLISMEAPFLITSGCFRTKSQPIWEKKNPLRALCGSASVSVYLWCTRWSLTHS